MDHDSLCPGVDDCIALFIFCRRSHDSIEIGKTRSAQIHDILTKGEIHHMIGARDIGCTETEDIVPGSTGQAVAASPAAQIVSVIPAIKAVITAAAPENVIPRPANKEVIASLPIQEILTAAAIDRIIVISGPDDVVTGLGKDLVHTGSTIDEIVPTPPNDEIIAKPGNDGIVAIIAVNVIITACAEKRIVPLSAPEPIGPAITGQKVIAFQPTETVSSRRADENIVSLGAKCRHDSCPFSPSVENEPDQSDRGRHNVTEITNWCRAEPCRKMLVNRMIQTRYGPCRRQGCPPSFPYAENAENLCTALKSVEARSETA
jgi:hypothetical protein